MSILLDSTTKVIVQGITGREGSFHTEQMQALGTKVVGGTSPGKGGTTHLGLPVFNTVADAVEATGAGASGIFVPAPFAADAIMEAAAAGMGQSTIVGIGGDPVLGMTFSDVVQLFENDPATTHLVLIGEIGGSDEEHAAGLIARGSRLKTVAFISGRTAPEGKRMGHAGAIISGNRGTAKSKEEAFRKAGVAVAETTDEIVGLLR